MNALDDNKRKLKRRHLIYYLRVFQRGNNALIGHMVDVTREGIMIMSEEPIEADKDFEFRMDLPAEIWGKKFIDFDARSLWCRKDANPDFYNTGFTMLKIAPADMTAIDRLVSQYGFQD